jgi:hypothetical protein
MDAPQAGGETPRSPGQPDVCQLGDVPIDEAVLDVINVSGVDPGKINILTMDTPGSKLDAQDYHAALRADPTPGTVTENQVKMLNDAKTAGAARAAHHFRVLTTEAMWEAVRVIQATAQALTRHDKAVCKTSMYEVWTHCVRGVQSRTISHQ